MAQTTGGYSTKNAKVEMSVNGSSWTDISGFSNTVAISGGDRATGEQLTNAGDVPIITAGKRGALTVTAKVVFTEGASDPATTANTAYEAGSAFYLRWTPSAQSGSGLKMYTTSAGIVKSPVYPGTSSEDAKAAMISIAIVVASIAPSTTA